MPKRYHKFYFYKPDPDDVDDFSELDEEAILALFTEQACIVDSSFDGNWDEEDVTDSCSDGIKESILTTLNTAIGLNGFRKRTAGDAIPTWYQDVLDCFESGDPIYALMLDGSKTVAGSHGAWLLAAVKQNKMDNKTSGGNTFDLSLVAYGAISGIPKFGFITVPGSV